MKIFTITENVAEQILLHYEKDSGAWVLRRVSKINDSTSGVALSSEEAQKIAEIILKEGVK